MVIFATQIGTQKTIETQALPQYIWGNEPNK